MPEGRGRVARCRAAVAGAAGDAVAGRGAKPRVFAILASLQRRATPRTIVFGLAGAWMVRSRRLHSCLLSRVGEVANAKLRRPRPTTEPTPSCTSTPPHHTTAHHPPRAPQPWVCPSKPSSRTGSCSACVNGPACPPPARTDVCRCSRSAPCPSASSRRCRTVARRPGAEWTHGTG
jgi:hypothetical protein